MALDDMKDGLVLSAPRNLTGKLVTDIISAARREPEGGVVGVVMDLNDTVFIDSSGIGALVSTALEFRNTGITFTLRNLTGEIQELFAGTGLDMIFSIETPAGIDSVRQDIFDTGADADIRLEINQEYDGDICIFHLGGVMNHPVGSRFFKRQFLLAMARFDKIMIDFENLTFFDSLSVSVILTMNKLLKWTGGSMRLCTANSMVNDLFSTLNIKQIIPVFEDIAQAGAGWS